MFKYFVVVMLFLVVGAEAQVVEPAKDVNWLKEIWKVIEPLWDAVIWPALGIIAVFLARKFVGDRAAQILQDMLQSAAKRAAGKALMENKAPLVADQPNPQLIKTGVDYLKSTMPDTIKKLQVGDERLKEIVTANVGILLSPSEGKK